MDPDLEFYDQIQKLQNDKGETGASIETYSQRLSVEFKDFLEPNLIKTGHIIPLSGGHCGTFSKTERNLFEIHLTNAGFIIDLQNLIVEN